MICGRCSDRILHVSRGDLNRPSLVLQTIVCQVRRSVWLGWPRRWPPCRPRNHLHPYGARCGAGGRLAEVARLECGVLTSETGEESGSNWKQALLDNRVKAWWPRRRWDGLRQAGSGLRDPLPDAGFGGGLLPAGRAGQGGRSTQLTGCCSAARKRRTSPTTSSRVLSRRGRRSAVCSKRWRQRRRVFRFLN